jgi:general secretion pathway protein I
VRSRGFTLVEVLVALFVLAIALAAAARSLGEAIDGAVALRERTLARWVAEDRLAVLVARREWPALDVTEGDVEMGGRSLHWRQRVLPTPLERLRRVEVSVFVPPARTPAARLSATLRREVTP